MRAFIFLFCTLTFAITPNNGFSQNSKININRNMELTIDQVFELIDSQTDYTFIYSTDLFTNSPLIKLKKGIIKTEKLLNLSLENSGYTYYLTDDNTIVLNKKIPIKNNSEEEIEIQQLTITGTVSDMEGNSLPGVNVITGNVGDKLAKGVATDFDGKFSVRASKGGYIRFSYIGYITQEFIIENQTEFNIVLKENVSGLEEVVISTGYQKISKERTTGSFQQVGLEVLDTKISQDILSKLEGEVSGVLFDDQDGPTIRGVSTINAINDPLIVVDGFPITQDFNSINANDIKDVTVLKDAAAASIWGIRAANGVIVITTKKGNKNGKPQIDVSTNFSVTPKDNLQDLPYASTNSFLEYEKHKADYEWAILPTGSSQPAFSKGLETYLLLNDGQITQSQADAIIDGLRGIDSRKEFSKLFMDDEYWSQYNVGVSGGGNNSTYRGSISYNKNQNSGFFAGNESDQLTASMRNSFDLGSKFTVNTDINFTTSKGTSNGMTSSDYSTLFQYQSILDDQGNYIPQPRGISQDFKDLKVAEGYPYNWDYNLQQEFDNKNNESRTTLMRIQTSIEYDIFDFLSLKGSYQYEWSNINSTQLSNENTYSARNLVNTYTSFDTTTNGLVSHVGKGSLFSTQNRIDKAHQGRLQLNFDKSFNDGMHKVNALLGYEVRQELYNGSSLSLYGYDPQSLSSVNVAFGERVLVTPATGTRSINNPNTVSEDEDRYISSYANVGYTYNNKYTFTSSIRLDDTNLFGASNNYRKVPLYSFGGKWDLHKENFMNNASNVDRLSLRVSYGVNGNSDNSTSPFLQATVSRGYPADILFAFISDVKNPGLRLEKVYVTNLGVDFGLFNGIVNGGIEYYIRKSEDLLAPVSFPSVYGFNSAIINAGKMENKGFDFNANVKVLDKSAFKYNTTLNFSYNKNEVTEVDVPEQTIDTYLNSQPLNNKPLRYIYSYQFAGLDANGDPLTIDENGQLIDVNGQTEVNGIKEDARIVNPEALVYGGTTTPKYYGAWINNISYKNFYLRSLITYKLGHVFRNTDILVYNRNQYIDANIHKDFENRWQNPGDENTTIIPRIPTTSGDATIGYSTYANGNQFIDSASHIRFKEVVLGYNFDSKLLKQIGLNNLSISAQARNLGLINFNKWDKDPESLVLPTNPTYTLNFSANF
ncbi:SusC/RagA family TonB-linked outer membrane protein [Lutibacter citreus]|uniref:SusC/RagA family TonB-linked outer membrane protein n=1 Tax=Lutibacter citreus TaxID=2138210 RepID=UPI0013007F08|nr:SusC/RagA family TonB-linked outer membrane protein [Lutibacter citreus]